MNVARQGRQQTKIRAEPASDWNIGRYGISLMRAALLLKALILPALRIHAVADFLTAHNSLKRR
jgi:hypothetical protein